MKIGYLERHNPGQNMRRFYAIHITRTLFGNWAMIREWGRIGQPGTMRESGFETKEHARQAGLALRSHKERRGYAPISGRPLGVQQQRASIIQQSLKPTGLNHVTRTASSRSASVSKKPK